MSISNLLPLIVADLDRPRQGFLIMDQSKRIVHASSSFWVVLGLPEDLPLVGEDFGRLLTLAFARCEADSSKVTDWPELCTERKSAAVPEHRLLLTAMGARTLRASLDPVGEQYQIISFDDVTAKLEAESQMLAIAYRDQLTGVGNRSLFEKKLEENLVRVATGELPAATVFFLDLDRFKVINDTLGHAVGDKLLRLVSERLLSVLRGSDTLARMGGDEFAILLPDSPGRSGASALASRMIDLIQRTYLIDGQVMNVGVSIGIAVAPRDGHSHEHLLKSADLALYHSKASGRGVFHFFEPLMEEKAQRRRSLELDLRKALVLRQFELHYQPQIDVETQSIIGVEGLLRWRHPQRGLVMPENFISLAEEIGLAAPIGDWVLKTACREATRLPESVTMAVNVSPLHFEMGTFAASVERALAASDLPGCRLEIEVTEDVLQKNGPTVLATLNALRALQVKVAMDSFGTGLASLSQLVNFPFDKIKLDRSLISMHEGGGKNRAIVRAISALGQSLGISTLAGGVETLEHLAQVRAEGCSSVQGFFYSGAVSASELTHLFSTTLPLTGKLHPSSKGDL